jgi:hypothetical protein
MKVKELIEILMQYDEERIIKVSLDEGLFDIEEIIEDHYGNLFIE